MTRRVVLLLATLPLTFAPLAAARSGQDDAEEREFRGRKAFENNCLMCHSAPLIEGQRLTPAQWKAELTKMIGWGAPVPKDEEPALLDYLNRHFGEKVPPAPPARLTVAEGERQVASGRDEQESVAGAEDRGAALYAQHCASCHGPAGRGGEGGTNLVDRPILDQPAGFRSAVREGRNRMPGFAKSLDRRAESDLLAWLRGRAR